jgi:cytochrome P450
MIPDFSFHTGMKYFSKYGDVVCIACPSNLMFFTANAESIHQITTRREHFPKPTDRYAILNQFGRNVITTEAAEWRMHRKATATSFNEKNSALVFRESIRQAQGMLDHWTKGETLVTLEHDTMRFALNIIGYVGFGLKLPWPHEENKGGFHPKYGSIKPPPGFTYSFVDTMAQLLDNVLMLLLVPNWLLKLAPSKRGKMAVDSRQDYEKYMQELLEEKIAEALKGERPKEGMDLIGQLVRSSYELDSKQVGQKGANGSTTPRSITLSRDEITGNAFVMLVAGHETTANAVHFCLLHLAANPTSQRRLQQDIDRLVGDSDPSTWDYEALINPMMASMLGACMNETLRVLPSVVEIPKVVTPDQDQTIVIDGKSHVVPAGAQVAISAAAVHKNPRYWPAKPSKLEPGRDDVADFVPERWFRKAESKAEVDESADDEDFGGFQGRDTSEHLFRPERGAYVPFSDGARACLGRRIAQVELLAALAVLFRRYSIELSVDDEIKNGQEIDKMSQGEKWDLYRKTADKTRDTMASASSLLTLKLHGKYVAVRVVERGQEKFVNWLDEGVRPV